MQFIVLLTCEDADYGCNILIVRVVCVGSWMLVLFKNERTQFIVKLGRATVVMGYSVVLGMVLLLLLLVNRHCYHQCGVCVARLRLYV